MTRLLKIAVLLPRVTFLACFLLLLTADTTVVYIDVLAVLSLLGQNEISTPGRFFVVVNYIIIGDSSCKTEVEI
jgi:hypothetical protein